MKLRFCIPYPLLPHSHTLTKAICSSCSFFLDTLEEQVDATKEHFKNAFTKCSYQKEKKRQ